MRGLVHLVFGVWDWLFAYGLTDRHLFIRDFENIFSITLCPILQIRKTESEDFGIKCRTSLVGKRKHRKSREGAPWRHASQRFRSPARTSLGGPAIFWKKVVSNLNFRFPRRPTKQIAKSCERKVSEVTCCSKREPTLQPSASLNGEKVRAAREHPNSLEFLELP
jgi:hypothetical protein